MFFVKDDGGRKAAGYKGTTGDCVCRSIAIATGLPYQTVYDALAEGNATQRRHRSVIRKGKRQERSAANGINTRRKWFKDYMHGLGFTWHPTMSIGSGCQVHLRDGELPMGRLVVAVSKHYTAVISGVVRDIYMPDRDGTRCVYGYWKLSNLT